MSKSRLKTRTGGRVLGREARAAHAAPAPSGDVVALFGAALGHHQAARLAEAEPLYRRILEIQPMHFDALHLLGVIHHQRGEHIAAIRQIDAALRINPAAASAHNNRGVALAELARHGEALESYDRAVALAPDYVDARFNRGNALKELGRLDEALASYDGVLALAADHAVAFAKRGNVLSRWGGSTRRSRAMPARSRCTRATAKHSTTAAWRSSSSDVSPRRWKAARGRSRSGPTMPRR
jgi:tetratricopeptide (TPR) repeat protein